MQKLLIIILLIIIPFNVYAYEKKEVTLNKCVDGDTAWFNLNEEKIKARFLAIDTPESTNKIEFFGKEASKYTCNKLKKANKIEIEYDENSNKYDKYNRNLVWVWIDNELLQNLIIENGYGKVAYLYGDYKYTALLKKSEKNAQEKNIGIWNKENNEIQKSSNDNEYGYKFYLICIIILIICYICSKSFRKNINKRVKKRIKG